MRRVVCAALAAVLIVPVAEAQSSRRRTTRKPAAATTKKAAAELRCPALLGRGVKTERSFCDVLTGRDPAEGIIVTIPPHTGPVTLSFDLHNRHTYSEEEIREKKAYAEYTATIGVLTPKSELVSRAVVSSSFRSAADLVDRVAGGAGPRGVKAVAPTGTEPIVVTLPQDVSEVSLLGERLFVRRLEGDETYTSPGRPIAVVSNVMVEYRPAPAKRAPARKPTTKPK